ncbi:MAG: hypothetical protein ABIT08_09885 [Bacteroidia bacterium]
MSKNYLVNHHESKEENSTQRHFKIFTSSTEIWFYVIFLLGLLLFSFISEGQTYPASFDKVQLTGGISDPANMKFSH